MAREEPAGISEFTAADALEVDQELQQLREEQKLKFQELTERFIKEIITREDVISKRAFLESGPKDLKACLEQAVRATSHAKLAEKRIELAKQRIIKAARDLLRQDPQVLVIGEIRDEETAAIAVQAAFTGHLVLSTLHAGSCAGVFERMLGMCHDRYAAVSAVDLVVNQRLIRSLCPECSGSGCGNCLQTGYQGRRPLVEWIRVDDALRKRLRTHRANPIKAPSTLEDEAAILVRRKITSRNEVRRMFAK
jgi:hypothetical protein